MHLCSKVALAVGRDEAWCKFKQLHSLKLSPELSISKRRYAKWAYVGILRMFNWLHASKIGTKVDRVASVNYRQNLDWLPEEVQSAAAASTYPSRKMCHSLACVGQYSVWVCCISDAVLIDLAKPV